MSISWSDVITQMKAVESHYGGTVTLVAYPIGDGARVRMHLDVTVTVPLLELNGRVLTAGVAGEFPHSDHSTMQGLAYQLVHLCDVALSRRWHQNELPEG